MTPRLLCLTLRRLRDFCLYSQRLTDVAKRIPGYTNYFRDLEMARGRGPTWRREDVRRRKNREAATRVSGETFSYWLTAGLGKKSRR